MGDTHIRRSLWLRYEQELHLQFADLVGSLSRRLQATLHPLLSLNASRVHRPLIETMDVGGERPSVGPAFKVLERDVGSGKRTIAGNQAMEQIPCGGRGRFLALLTLQLQLLLLLLGCLLLLLVLKLELLSLLGRREHFTEGGLLQLGDNRSLRGGLWWQLRRLLQFGLQGQLELEIVQNDTAMLLGCGPGRTLQGNLQFEFLANRGILSKFEPRSGHAVQAIVQSEAEISLLSLRQWKRKVFDAEDLDE